MASTVVIVLPVPGLAINASKIVRMIQRADLRAKKDKRQGAWRKGRNGSDRLKLRRIIHDELVVYPRFDIFSSKQLIYSRKR